MRSKIYGAPWNEEIFNGAKKDIENTNVLATVRHQHRENRLRKKNNDAFGIFQSSGKGERDIFATQIIDPSEKKFEGEFIG